MPLLTKLLYPEFEHEYSFVKDDIKYLDSKWINFDKVDYINFDMAMKYVASSKLVKGLFKPEYVMAVYRVKAIHSLSYKPVNKHSLSL